MPELIAAISRWLAWNSEAYIHVHVLYHNYSIYIIMIAELYWGVFILLLFLCQVCDQALEYQRQFDTANNSVTQTQDEHKSWQDGLQQQLKEEDKDTTTVTDQLPLPDLDTQQETLLLMLRKKIDNMEEEQKRQTMEGKKW